MLKIENELLTARINPVGAELSSLIKKNTEREYIWQAEPSVWGRHAPLLFPAVGRMSGDSFIYDGKKYFMQKHGFLRGSSFEVVEKTDNSALLRFSSNEKTLMSFPFEFDFDAEYSLSESTLVQRLTVTNKGDGNMYFSVGAHPAFNILIGDTLRFETPEHATLPYLDGNDTVGNPENKLILDGETDIVLSKELFENARSPLKLRLRLTRSLSAVTAFRICVRLSAKRRCSGSGQSRVRSLSALSPGAAPTSVCRQKILKTKRAFSVLLRLKVSPSPSPSQYSDRTFL